MTTRDSSLISVAGAPFMVTAFIARLPPAMVQMGLLMILVSAGHDYSVGGSAVAAVGLGSAVGAPLVGHLNDRLGPAPVTAVSLVVQALGLVGCLAVLTNGWPLAILLGLGAVVGASNPQVGAIARARWSRISRRQSDAGLVGRAMGYEGAVDEMSFIIGPAVASVLVGLTGPRVSLIVLIVVLILGQGSFLAYLWRRKSSWGHAAPATEAPELAGPSGQGRIGASVLIPVLCGLAVGTMFGSTQTALGALYSDLGNPSATGIIYGTLGIGSAFASVMVGRLPARIPPWLRLVVGGAVVAGAVAMLGQQSSVIPSIAWCIVGGLGVGVVLVTAYGMLELVAPTSRLTAMMTWVATAVVLGVSVGAFIAGRVADAFGSRAAFVGSVTAGAVAALVGLTAVRLPRRTG